MDDTDTDTEEDDMGAWGYGAYENDAAGDWLFKHVVPRLLRTITVKGAYTHQVLAALAVAHDLGLAPWLDAAEVDAAFARIEEADEASGWDDPARRRRYVRTLQRRINKVLGAAAAQAALRALPKKLLQKGAMRAAAQAALRALPKKLLQKGAMRAAARDAAALVEELAVTASERSEFG